MSETNKQLFLDIYHDVPISRSRSFQDADTIKFMVDGQVVEAVAWYIDKNNEFVIELENKIR